MYEISITTHFSAAHHLENYQGSCEAHHGHNWEIEVFVSGSELDDTGLLIDFRELKGRTAEVIGGLDHVDLNTLSAFSEENPTSENIARYIWEQLSEKINCERYRVSRVDVHETPGSVASYRGGAL